MQFFVFTWHTQTSANGYPSQTDCTEKNYMYFCNANRYLEGLQDTF